MCQIATSKVDHASKSMMSSAIDSYSVMRSEGSQGACQVAIKWRMAVLFIHKLFFKNGRRSNQESVAMSRGKFSVNEYVENGDGK